MHAFLFFDFIHIELSALANDCTSRLLYVYATTVKYGTVTSSFSLGLITATVLVDLASHMALSRLLLDTSLPATSRSRLQQRCPSRLAC